MTETNMNTSNPYAGERRPGTVGLPLPGVELRVAEAGAEVPRGTPGVIEVRGPNVFAGYWRMPEKTAEDLRPDGWFVTGDVGVQGEDGYVTIVGRAKDVVITGGFNVYPREVELLLDEAPGVLESAVVGLPHPDFGEAVFAVLAADPAGPRPDPGAVLATLDGRLARFKQPKAAVVVEALPRNAMGKVQKAELRRSYAGWFAGGA
jgi:malonyl-CoA/methylmalonyl-CoA synthetase